MAGDKQPYKPSFSELALLAILIVLVALTRVYYGGGRAPMVVWKDELSFHDTLVNIGEFASLPHDVLLKDHRSVLYQLESMEILEPTDVELESIRHRHWHGRQLNVPRETTPGSKPSQERESGQSDKAKEAGDNEQH
jgi:hypothetical protein